MQLQAKADDDIPNTNLYAQVEEYDTNDTKRIKCFCCTMSVTTLTVACKNTITCHITDLGNQESEER